jgi:hypothetical protein
MPRKVRSFHCFPFLLLAASLIQAQDGTKENFVHAQQQNASQLRQYVWTSRTVLKLKDEVRKVRMESVHYGANGQLQKTTIETPPEQQPQGGGPEKKVGAKKKEEFTQLLGSLARLAQSYANLTPGETQAFAQGATISSDQVAGTILLQGENVVVKGDSVIVRVDPSTLLLRQVDIDSFYQKNPVKLIIAFQMLSEGLNYPSQILLSYPKKEVDVIVQNSMYQRLPDALSGKGR